MKELLKTYYNVFNTINIVEDTNYTYFIYNSQKYLLTLFNRSEEELKDIIALNQELLTKNIPTAKFVINNYNSILTSFNNQQYILLVMPLQLDQEYNVLDMIELSKKLVVKVKKSILYRNNWASLWSSKMDYFEYQISQLGREKYLVINSFNYYVGLVENAIAYVNNTTRKYQISINEHITLQHKRIDFPNLSINYFNPLNYIIDIEVRDIASYFQALFFNSYEDLFIEVNAYFKRKKLSIYGYQLLYARLLYPSFYFDTYEKIMAGEEEEKALLTFIAKRVEYEEFLKDMYFIILKYAPIEPINWLINEKEL